MSADIIQFKRVTSIYVAHGTDGFYVALDGTSGEAILGGPHSLKSNAEVEAAFLAADFGARIHVGGRS